MGVSFSGDNYVTTLIMQKMLWYVKEKLIMFFFSISVLSEGHIFEQKGGMSDPYVFSKIAHSLNTTGMPRRHCLISLFLSVKKFFMMSNLDLPWPNNRPNEQLSYLASKCCKMQHERWKAQILFKKRNKEDFVEVIQLSYFIPVLKLR